MPQPACAYGTTIVASARALNTGTILKLEDLITSS